MSRISCVVLGVAVHALAVGGLALVLFAPTVQQPDIARAAGAVLIGLLTVAAVGPVAVVAGYRYGARRAFQDALPLRRADDLLRAVAQGWGPFKRLRGRGSARLKILRAT